GDIGHTFRHGPFVSRISVARECRRVVDADPARVGIFRRSSRACLCAHITVMATFLASAPTRDVAILWVNPSVITSQRPLPLGCGQTRPSVANGQELYTIGAEMTGQKDLTPGDVTGVESRLLLSDLTIARASSGGPVFTAGGLIGFTTVDDRDPDGRSNARVVRIDQACEVIA